MSAGEYEPEDRDAVVRLFGARVGNLTQVTATLWLDFDAVEELCFDPSDGCGCEIQYKSGEVTHLKSWAADCLKLLLTSQQQEVADLERMAMRTEAR
jgi:hypothetical protein